MWRASMEWMMFTKMEFLFLRVFCSSFRVLNVVWISTVLPSTCNENLRSWYSTFRFLITTTKSELGFIIHVILSLWCATLFWRVFISWISFLIVIVIDIIIVLTNISNACFERVTPIFLSSSLIYEYEVRYEAE